MRGYNESSAPKVGCRLLPGAVQAAARQPRGPLRGSTAVLCSKQHLNYEFVSLQPCARSNTSLVCVLLAQGRQHYRLSDMGASPLSLLSTLTPNAFHSAVQGRHNYRLSDLGADIEAVTRHLLAETEQKQVRFLCFVRPSVLHYHCRPMPNYTATRAPIPKLSMQLVLAGHDWGANACWAAAHASPQLFSRLAIL